MSTDKYCEKRKVENKKLELKNKNSNRVTDLKELRKVREVKRTMCNGKCIYFPNESYNNAPYTCDEYGVKHSNVNPKCGFDFHSIKNWCECEHYREAKSKYDD